jgi:hypothetical protein
MDEGIRSQLAGAALAGAAALGGGAAYAGTPDAGALQQALKQQVSTKTQIQKPQAPIAQSGQPAFVNTDIDVLKQVARGTMQHPNIRQVDAVKALQWLNANPGYQDVKPSNPKASQYNDDTSTLHVYKPEQYRDVPEAANPAQQAAIAIAMKKAHKKPKQIDELDVNTLKSYADKRGAQVAAMKADNPNPATGSKEWIQQAVPAQQVNLAKRKIARKERQAGVTEAEKEPTTRQELLNRLDKIQRMMTQDRNPANLQILRKELEMLKQRYQHLREDNDSEAVERAILNRIMVAHTDLLLKYGPDKVMQAAEEVAYNVGAVDEIGTSDVSAYVNQVRQILGAK